MTAAHRATRFSVTVADLQAEFESEHPDAAHRECCFRLLPNGFEGHVCR